MRSIRHYWLLPGKVPGDVVGVTVVMVGGRIVRVQEWVMAPQGVLRKWLLPLGMVAE